MVCRGSGDRCAAPRRSPHAPRRSGAPQDLRSVLQRLQQVPTHVELSSSPILHIGSKFHEILGFEGFKRRGWVRISRETLRKTFLGSLEKHQKNIFFVNFIFQGYTAPWIPMAGSTNRLKSPHIHAFTIGNPIEKSWIFRKFPKIQKIPKPNALRTIRNTLGLSEFRCGIDYYTHKQSIA